MKIFLGILSVVFISGCSGGGGSDSGTPTPDVSPSPSPDSSSPKSYSATFSYPGNSLNPGDGELEVGANGIANCQDQSGQSVDTSLCSDQLPSAPKRVLKSPAGDVSESVESDDPSGFSNVLVPVLEGEAWTSKTLSEKSAKVLSAITTSNLLCPSDKHRNSNGFFCLPDTYTATFVSPGNSSTNACDGIVTLNKVMDECVRDHDGFKDITLAKCAGQTTSETVNVPSKAGIAFLNSIKNGQRNVSCAEGVLKSVADDNPANIIVVCGSGAYPSGAVKCRLNIKSVSAGYIHTCAIASDNNAYCWGAGSMGQLGNLQNSDSSSPVLVADGEIDSSFIIKKISSGNDHTCALAGLPGDDASNELYCWGDNDYNQLGIVGSTAYNYPKLVSKGDAPPESKFIQVSSGWDTTCAIASNGRAYCWGKGTNGQLGNSAKANSPNPTLVSMGSIPGSFVFKKIAVGANQTCAIAGDPGINDDRVYCWGRNDSGQLGTNNTSEYASPMPVNGSGVINGLSVKEVSSAGFHTCIIAGSPLNDDSDSAYCWGANSTGQIGDGSTSGTLIPVSVINGQIPSGVHLKSLSSRGFFNCAITSLDKVYCWGTNGSGQLGIGSTAQANSPSEVLLGDIPSGSTIKEVSLGSSHVCAVSSEDKIYCWGLGTSGQLGRPSTPSATTPKSTLAGETE